MNPSTRTELLTIIVNAARELGLTERDIAVIESMVTFRATGGLRQSEIEMAEIDVCGECHERCCICPEEFS